jgi:hypothetical protein
MQLNEILEENTVNAISTKTNIAENNIDALVAADFEKITRVKTMGFISIIEREYNADLSALKEQALEYYNTHNEDEKVTLGLPISEEKKGKSKWFMTLVLLLIIYAIWYAFDNLDKEKLNAMLPFSEDKLSEMIIPEKKNDIEESKTASELSIEHANGMDTQDEANDTTENNRSY